MGNQAQLCGMDNYHTCFTPARYLNAGFRLMNHETGGYFNLFIAIGHENIYIIFLSNNR